MALKIHRSDHPDLLVDALCDVIAPPPADPFAREVIAVPTRGIDRWLTERIGATFARRGIGDGIAANIDFPLLHRVITDVLSRAPETAPSIEARSGGALVAHLDLLLHDHAADPRIAIVTRFVTGPDGEATGVQRLRAARKIAGLFSSYERYRPAMIAAWSRGDDVGTAGEPIDESAAWQPYLWRLLDAGVGVPALSLMLPPAVETIRSGTVPLDLPERISLYGVTTLNPADLSVLDAIASTRDVHLFLLHPSPALWTAIAPLAGNGHAPIPLQRSEDPTGEAAVHPLLRSWARESRELQITLGAADTAGTDERTSPEPSTTNLLATIQQDVRHNHTPTTGGPVGEHDRSVQIHACHGARRQVEVLRDALLHVMADTPDIEPRDIVIMTPDLETFGPLLEAAFPAVRNDAAETPDLRVRIADRAPVHTNPLVRLAGIVLELAASRLEAATVREFAALPDVRRRFSIDDDTGALIDTLVADANVRWGLDGEHRRRAGAGPRDEHTWARAGDRVLTGVFFSDEADRVIADIAPLTGIEGEHATAAGRLGHLLDRIAAVTDLLNRPRPLPGWRDAIATAVRLLAVPARGDEWQWDELGRLLDETFDPGGSIGPDADLAEAALLIEPWTADRPSALHHRTGNVTVCSLVPMRSVPYRVVVLLGLDDERFPRGSRSDGDDLLAAGEAVGDRDRGAEDRQLLLDAFMAAGDHLIITYSGHDELTNAAYPPAVPVAELIDLVTDMAGPAVAERIVIRHHLQPFNPLNFIPGALIPGEPWSFDPMQHRGADAVRERSVETVTPGIAIPDDADTGTVAGLRLDDLITFLQHPAKAFLWNRLGMRIPELDDGADDTLPTELAPLEKWSVTDRILSGLADGTAIESLVARERAADAVPAGELADSDLEAAVKTAERLWTTAARGGYDPAAVEAVPGTVVVAGITIEGSVLAAPASARTDLVTPSRLKGKQRIAAYARLVFLSALDPTRPWKARIVGKNSSGPSLAIVTMGPIGATGTERTDLARERLEDLVRLYQEGMAEPIPLFCETSYTWATTNARQRTDKAAEKWMPGWYNYDPERDQPAHRLLFPTLDTFEAVLGTDFAAIADDLWRPILQITGEATA